MPDLIAEAWQSYEANVLPKDAGPVQRQETRRAFYAGAWAVLSICGEIGGDGISEAQGVEILDGLHRESRDFVARVKAGSA